MHWAQTQLCLPFLLEKTSVVFSEFQRFSKTNPLLRQNDLYKLLNLTERTEFWLRPIPLCRDFNFVRDSILVFRRICINCFDTELWSFPPVSSRRSQSSTRMNSRNGEYSIRWRAAVYDAAKAKNMIIYANEYIRKHKNIVLIAIE